MSIRIMAQVWESGPTDQAERFVMLALADFANDEGECWPSMAGIAAKCCMSDRGVRKVIRRLEEGGWLSIAVGGGRHGCSKYQLNPEPETRNDVPHPGTRNPEPRSAPRNHSAKTRNLSAQNPEPGSAEPSLTIKEPSDLIDTPASVLSHHADHGAVDSFIAYRKRHKSKALTLTGARRLAAHLAEINERGGDATDALGMAEERGWASVQPDWYFNAKGKGHGKPAAEDPTLRAIARAAGAF